MKNTHLFLIQIISFVVLAISLLNCTNVLNVKHKELSVIEVPGQSYKLQIVNIPSNATIQSSIQVRKLLDDKEDEEILQDYERYNYLESYKLLGDTALMIVVKDTISYLGRKQLDTMIVKLK